MFDLILKAIVNLFSYENTLHTIPYKKNYFFLLQLFVL